MFVGVLARVSPGAVPSSPVDLIQQTGLFPKFPGVKEDFKLVGLNSSPQSGINSYRACLGAHLALCLWTPSSGAYVAAMAAASCEPDFASSGVPTATWLMMSLELI